MLYVNPRRIMQPRFNFQMRIILFFLILSNSIQLLAVPLKNQDIYKVQITLELKNESLVNVFKKIESKSSFYFMYRDEDVKSITNINVANSKQSIAAFLNLILTNTPLSFKQVDQRILIIHKDTRNVKTKGSEKYILDWLFHAPQNDGNQRSMSYSGQRLKIVRPTARLTMDVLSLEITSAVMRDRYDKKFPECYISLPSKPDISVVNFLAVILPEAKPTSGDYEQLPITTRVDSARWIGARVKLASKTYFGVFNTTSGANGSIAGFNTDDKRFTVSLDEKETPHTLYFDGSSFSGKGLKITSSTPLTLALSFDSNQTTIETESKQATTLTLLITAAPAGVKQDGMYLRNWQFDEATRMLTIPVPEGRHDLGVQ